MDGCPGLLFGVNQHFPRVGEVWKDKWKPRASQLISQTSQQGDRLHTAAVLQLTWWKRSVAERWLTFVQ